MLRFKRTSPRDSRSIVKDYGHIELSAACIKANQTGYFALGERIKPDSFDGNDTNINASDCFFGGRKIDTALTMQRADELANKPVDKPSSPGDGDGSPSGEGGEA